MGRNRDEKVDSGSISIDISPFESFSLNPQYEVRRTLEKQDPNNQGDVVSAVSRNRQPQQQRWGDRRTAAVPVFTIAEREHRLALNPRLNRDLLGIRPTINNRVSLNEKLVRRSKRCPDQRKCQLRTQCPPTGVVRLVVPRTGT